MAAAWSHVQADRVLLVEVTAVTGYIGERESCVKIKLLRRGEEHN